MDNKEYLQQLLPKLAQEIPYQWRVQSFSPAKDSCTVVAYIDARDAMDLLDECCEYGWTNRYELIDGQLFSHIGIYLPNGEIMWRSDVGTEAQTEAEKSKSSDSFKRAAVRFGVGRFLYAKEIQRLAANPNNGKPYPIDENGKRIWNITDHVNKIYGKPKAKPQVVTTPKQPDLKPSQEFKLDAERTKLKDAFVKLNKDWKVVESSILLASIEAEHKGKAKQFKDFDDFVANCEIGLARTAYSAIVK